MSIEHLVRCEVVAQVIDLKGDVVAEFDRARGVFSDEPLNKVLPADTGPLVATWWICPTCGLERRGGPPATCGTDNPDCPIR